MASISLFVDTTKPSVCPALTRDADAVASVVGGGTTSGTAHALNARLRKAGYAVQSISYENDGHTAVLTYAKAAPKAAVAARAAAVVKATPKDKGLAFYGKALLAAEKVSPGHQAVLFQNDAGNIVVENRGKTAVLVSYAYGGGSTQTRIGFYNEAGLFSERPTDYLSTWMDKSRDLLSGGLPVPTAADNAIADAAEEGSLLAHGV